MEKLELVKKEDGYSFYKNPDAEILKGILAIPRPTSFHEWRHGECKFVKELPNGNYMCESSDGDVLTVTKEDYEEAIKTSLIRDINLKYSVFDTMNKYFMPMNSQRGVLVKYDTKFLGKSYERDVTGVEPTLLTEEWGYYFGREYLEIEYRRDGLSSSAIYFTEEGLIANRDYNNDLNKIGNVDFRSKEEMVNEIISEFDVFDTIERQGKMWFTPGKCFIIEDLVPKNDDKFYIETLKHQYDNTFYNNGNSRGKKIKNPNKVEVVNISEFTTLLKSKINEFLNIK